MRRIVLEAVRAGAVGFATSTLEQHNGENGIPMPSRLADDKEIPAPTGALGEAGRGGLLLTQGMNTAIPRADDIPPPHRRAPVVRAQFRPPRGPPRPVPP